MSAPEPVRPVRPVGRWVVVGMIAVLLVGGGVWAAVANSGAGTASAAASGPSASASATPSASTPAAEGPQAAVTPTQPAPGQPGGGATGDADPNAPYAPVTKDAVPLDAKATFDSGVTARLVKVESVDGEAQGPGEVAGPSVRVTVELTNGTADAVGLGTTLVNVYAGQDLVPAEPLSGPGAKPFAGSLAPGDSAQGVYVFNVPAAQRDRLQVTVSYDPTVTTVLFEGAGPKA